MVISKFAHHKTRITLVRYMEYDSFILEYGLGERIFIDFISSLLVGVVITVPYGGAQRDLYVILNGGVAGGINDKTAILLI